MQSQSPQAHGSVAVQVAAAAADVRVLDLLEGEVRLPVRAFLGERRRAVADLDPLHAAVVELARGIHVPEVFVAGHRAETERSVGNRRRSALLRVQA